MYRMVVGRDRVLTQLRRGTLEFCVLALLRGKERYGFELVKALSAADGMVTSEGTIYPLLSRLRKDGLVTSSWVESPNGPPRRYYRLTDEGTAALAAFVEDWQRYRDSVDGFLGGGARP
jgi:PadR family transcriptional regulator PadR